LHAAKVRVVLIHGSPRPRGNTDILLERLAEGAKDAGAEVEHLYVRKLRVSPCVGCGKCEEGGRCVLDDPMQGIYPLLEQAHRLVIGTPVYFYGVTAQLKALIDRCQALWSRKYVLKDPLPTELGGIERRGYVVAVAASSGKRVFEGVNLTAKIFFDALSVRHAGELLVSGVDRKGAVLDRKADLDRVFGLGKEVGKAA
jgi:multimeric flavodoxin WrbA